MASFQRPVLLLLLCFVQRCICQSTTVTFSPTKIQLTTNTTTTGTEVTVSCDTTGIQQGFLLALNIERLPFGSQSGATRTTLVTAALNTNSGTAQLQGSMANAEAEGSLSARPIRLIMERARCNDEGIYFCVVTYLPTGGSVITLESDGELKVEVTPAPVSMVVTPEDPPSDQDTWSVGDDIVLTCTAAVGTVNTTGTTDNPQITWTWQYKDAPSTDSFLTPSWTTYSNVSDISTGNLVSISCYKNQTSTLSRSLTLSDSNRQYRCYYQRNSQGYLNEAASYTLGEVTATGQTDDEVTTDTSSGSVGPIVGGVFGSLVVIVIIVIIVYFLVIRPRRRKEEKEYPDGTAEKGDDSEPVPPYTADADVVYSKPSRRPKDKSEGVTNKGLDESDDKHGPPDTKLPPDNDDKRHGRRHKDKKQHSPPLAPAEPAVDDYDPRYDNLARNDRDHRRPRQKDYEEKPTYDRSHRYDDDRRGDDRRGDNDNRRARRPREGDNYDEKPSRYDDDYDRGRRNRGYERDNRARGHHSSSEDGGTDNSYVNTSQYSIGDGNPNIGTAI